MDGLLPTGQLSFIEMPSNKNILVLNRTFWSPVTWMFNPSFSPRYQLFFFLFLFFFFLNTMLTVVPVNNDNRIWHDNEKLLKILSLEAHLSASSLHCTMKCLRFRGDLISIWSLLAKSGTMSWSANNNGTLYIDLQSWTSITYKKGNTQSCKNTAKTCKVVIDYEDGKCLGPGWHELETVGSVA